MATNVAQLKSYDLNGVKESFANWISNISPSDTPFVSMTGKESVKNKFFNWQEDALGAINQSNAVAEGSEAGDASQSTTVVLNNVTQILRKVVSVSDTANSLSNYGRGRELQYQMEKAGKEIKRDIEWALLNNGTRVDGDATTARKTAGFTALVASKNANSPESSEAIVHRDVAVSGTLSEDDIFTLTKGLYLAGAKATHIMFHPKYAKVFSGLMEKVKGGAAVRQRMFDGAVDQRINAYVSEMVDPLGQRYVLLPNRFMPPDRIYFFNPSDWTQMVLREPGAQQLAKTGSFDKYMIEIELGLRHRNRYASGVLVVGSTVVPPNGDAAPSVTAPAAVQPNGTNKIATLNLTGGTGIRGNTIQINATAASGAIGTLSYSSEDNSVATVDSSGLITAKGVGSTRVKVTTGGTASYVRVVVFADGAVPEVRFVQSQGIVDGTTTVGATPFLDGSVVTNVASNTITYEWKKGADLAAANASTALTGAQVTPAGRFNFIAADTASAGSIVVVVKATGAAGGEVTDNATYTITA